jgi:hypothetical protein
MNIRRSLLRFEISPILSGFALGTAAAIGMWWEGMPGELIVVFAFFFTGLGAFWPVFNKFNSRPVDYNDPNRRRREIRSTVMAVIVTGLLFWLVDFVHLAIGMVLLMSISGHCILVQEITRWVRRRYSWGGTPVALLGEEESSGSRGASAA